MISIAPTNTVDCPRLFLITGIMAAGKSTVAQYLVERLPKSVHLRGDAFRRMIVSGRAEMGLELSPEAYDQLRLRYRVAAAAAELYLAAGFSVVYQDIIIGKDLAEVVRYYTRHMLYVVVLCPTSEAIVEREAGRSKTGYSTMATVDEFDRILRAETPRLGLWLDSSNLTVTETVDYILANLTKARVQATETA